MEELTIEQKAQRYDEAIERAKKWYNAPNVDKIPTYANRVIEEIFPELKETEAECVEKIKKDIISYLNNRQITSIAESNATARWLSWLEKQGTQNQVSIWKHWKDGICGNGEGKLIYLIKNGDDYRISSVLGCECDYIELSDLDELILPEKQGEQKSIDKIQLGKKYKCIASPRYTTFMIGEIYKPEDKFLCSLMNFCYGCFEPIEDGEQKPSDEDMVEALRTEYEKGRADAFAQMQKEWSEEDEKKQKKNY